MAAVETSKGHDAELAGGGSAAAARAEAEPGPRGGTARSGPLAVLVLSGANLDRLGEREPAIYGRETLAEIHARLGTLAAELGVTLEARQSNYEGDLVTWIGEAPSRGVHGLLLNPGGYTHTSVSILDALRGAALPAVEVHLSNPDAREAFRRRSRVAPGCIGRVAGFGGDSYLLALRGLVARLRGR